MNIPNIKHEIQNFIEENRTGVIAVLILVIILAAIVINNGSWIFQRNIVERFGDQQLYYSLALNILNGVNTKSPYTLGYPLFYMFFIIFTGFQTDWRSIMPQVIFTQAFLIIPAIIFLIYRKQTIKGILILSVILISYFLYNIWSAPDPLLKWNFFGLVPLSEPLSIFLTVCSYFIYFKTKNKTINIKYNILLGFLIALSLMVRSTSIILLAPIFIETLLQKKFKELLQISLSTFIFFLPQLWWNYWVSGSIFFSGYVWWADVVNPVKTRMDIFGLYGIDSSKMFSIDYLKINYYVLTTSYLTLILLVLYSRLWKSRLEVFVSLFTIINICFYLSYWWSINSHLIDRFLLPNFILVIYLLSEKLRRKEFDE